MKKTAMQQFKERLFDVRVIQNPITLDEMNDFIEIEKRQMCKMYIQGRNDNHLDYYPEKHAKETYDEFFNQTLKQNEPH